MTEPNPLLTSYTIPPFDQIKAEHYMPALNQAIAEAEVTLQRIKEEPHADFENTVAKLDGVFAGIKGIDSLFEMSYLADMSDEMKKVNKQLTNRIDDFKKLVFQDKKLCEHFEAVVAPPGGEDLMLYKKYKREFKSNGSLNL